MKISQSVTVMLPKAQLFFHIASISVDSFLPSLDKGMYSVPEQSPLLLHSNQHCTAFCSVTSSV